MKIIFLDIDGVLNTQDYFIKNHENVLNFYDSYPDYPYDGSLNLRVDRMMMDIDLKKLIILREIVKETGAKVVVISSWKSFGIFDEVAKRFINYGIPVIGKTIDNGDDRGCGIYKYLKEHDVSEYVILDDEIFEDYDEILLNNLVKTSFYEEGLTEEHAEKIIKKLKK